MIRRWGVAGALGLVTVLALVGCAASGELPTTPVGDPSPTSTSGTAVTEADETDTEDVAGEPAAEAAACLQGTWLADNAYFLAQMRELGDEPQSVNGRVTVTFGDAGELTTVYDGWRIVAIVDGSETVIERDGTDRGTYSHDDTRISMQETSMGSVLTLTAQGMQMPFDVDPINFVDAEYTCDATTATIATPEGPAILTRD
ncbi:hypothetical protein [Microbacterium sp. YY-01]|uniref:hypothetical protein n=1 Tax=Microbacterium sp. YY-01 TaxID=3421634 RepID=UPI003D16560A